jgi:hypothetical protein
VAAAAFAHGRFGGFGHVEIGSALKTANAPKLDNGLRRFRDGFDRLPDSEVGPATLANG